MFRVMLAFFPEWDNINSSFWNKHLLARIFRRLGYKDIDL